MAASTPRSWRWVPSWLCSISKTGTRKFADFATAMVEDIGEKFIPYLRSFYDATRSFLAWTPKA